MRNRPNRLNRAFVAGQLSADAGGAVHIAAMHRGGHGDQQCRIVVHDVGRVKAVGILLGDQIVLSRPCAKSRMFNQGGQKTDVVRHATDVKLVERIAQVGDGLHRGFAP